MPYRIEQFENNEIYHVTIRRIGDFLLFQKEDDYFRGIFSIFEFNNINSVIIRDCRNLRRQNKTVRDPHSDNLKLKEREPIVEVLAFCLMPNHIHLLLRQLKDGGISKYMNKFGSGYSRYFKDKYKIKMRGYFFQSRFVAVHIQDDEQLKTILTYIHTNPISLIEPKWKEIGIKNPEKVIEFLEDYKWSSYQDCLGKKNFPSVTEREFILEIMGGAEGCRELVNEWVKFKGEIREFSDLALEL